MYILTNEEQLISLTTWWMNLLGGRVRKVNKFC